MGLESSNFVFKPMGSKKDEFFLSQNLLLLKFGNLKKKSENTYVLYDSNYWVDFLLTTGANSFISIRIALCNPLEGIQSMLPNLFSNLFSIFSDGLLIDLDNNKEYNKINDKEFSEIFEHLRERKKSLEHAYGELRLPVSSSLFFKYISERS